MREHRCSRVISIIQARMGSKRFPGKMLAKLAGKPLLFHIISRAQKIELADEIVLATTTHERDDLLVDLAKSMNIKTIRGPENNVLERFLIAMDNTKADIIVRICGDAPLFDPDFLDKSISLLKENDADLIVLKHDMPNAYQGASVISARAIRWTWETGRDDPLACEHVTAYAQAHSDKLRTVEVDIDQELLGEFHLSIDTKYDLEIMNKIYDQLYMPGQIVDLRAAVKLIQAKSLRTTNSL
ncbi:MAG: NTP transferase domain-containing protein [Anaerolineales bacterium]|nr:NTP transferase domain-containing protein [Anaerolineales bacterium]